MKAVQEKPRSNIILNGEKVERFFSKITNKTRVPSLTTTIQHSIEVLATAISQEKEIKGIQIEKEETKLQKKKSGKKNPIGYSNKKNKVPRNKPNQGGKRSVLRKLHNTEERN